MYDTEKTGQVHYEDFRNMAETFGMQLDDDSLLALFKVRPLALSTQPLSTLSTRSMVRPRSQLSGRQGPPQPPPRHAPARLPRHAVRHARTWHVLKHVHGMELPWHATGSLRHCRCTTLRAPATWHTTTLPST